jgi:hypothetical protein
MADGKKAERQAELEAAIRKIRQKNWKTGQGTPRDCVDLARVEEQE